MSDIERLEQKIDSHDAKLDRLIETMTTFVAFQARAEERHSSNSKRFDKFEAKLEKLWDMVHRNALIVNGAVAVVTAVAIWWLKDILGG